MSDEENTLNLQNIILKKSIRNERSGSMKCPKCGNEISMGLEFCPACGWSLAEGEGNDNNEVLEEAPLQEKDREGGAETAGQCAACGVNIPEGAKVCPACGSAVCVEEAQEKSNLCQACGAQMPEGARFCPLCGNTVSGEGMQEELKYCPVCGKKMPEEALFCPACGWAKERSSRVPLRTLEKPSVFSFSGRARRREYWLTGLVISVLSVVLGFVLVSASKEINEMTAVVFVLALLGLPVSVRRCHDVGWSGWMLLVLCLIGFIPVFGEILAVSLSVLILGCIEGEHGTNRYGPDPKGKKNSNQ